MLRLMNAVLPITAKSITRREAAFHPSAEQYRARANLIKSSIGPATGGPERAALLDMAMEFERLAAELERMRTRSAKPDPDLPPEVPPCGWADRLVRRFGDLKRRMTKTKTSG